MPLANLYDVPGFGDLRRVTRRFGVEIKAIGGFVRRIASRLRDYSELPNDPLTLVPFTSDIDLIHSGQTAINADTGRKVHRVPPYHPSRACDTCGPSRRAVRTICRIRPCVNAVSGFGIASRQRLRRISLHVCLADDADSHGSSSNENRLPSPGFPGYPGLPTWGCLLVLLYYMNLEASSRSRGCGRTWEAPGTAGTRCGIGT